jgi:hypothetical protein
MPILHEKYGADCRKPGVATSGTVPVVVEKPAGAPTRRLADRYFFFTRSVSVVAL